MNTQLLVDALARDAQFHMIESPSDPVVILNLVQREKPQVVVISAKLGEDWSRTVRQLEASGEESLIYMRAEDKRMDLIVVSLNHGELDLVRMTMNPEQLAKWTREKDKTAMLQ